MVDREIDYRKVRPGVFFQLSRIPLTFCRSAMLALLLLAVVNRCEAVIIIEKGTAEPIRGFLVDANDVRVIVDVLAPDGQTKRRIFPRASLEEMIQAVSPEKLQSLRSDQPEAYRDYAEELAGKTNDPDARQTALRLYQIAAHLAPQKLGRSCLLGMIALARSPNEERKFRAAAYLLDPDHDRSVLHSSKAAGVGRMKLSDEQRQQLRQLLRALREGRIADARTTGKRASLQEPLKQIAPFLTLSDFDDLRNGDSLPPNLLYKVLSVELAIDPFANGRRSGDSLDENAPRPPSTWSKLSDPKFTDPAPELTLELLTEFDPRQCHYRNGKWQP